MAAFDLMFSTLVNVEELASHLDDADWIVCDCRHDLSNYESGRRDFQQSHIPGARFLHLDEDLSGPKTGTNGRHPLPHPRTFALRLGALGIDNTKQVIAYDASGGYYAARLWWMLRWVGHTRAAVLDGGWDAWKASRLHVTADPASIQPAAYTLRPGGAPVVDARFVAGHLNDKSTTVIDARSPDRFHGENETLDPVSGHIPGAVNHFFKLNLETDGRFKPADVLKSAFSEILGDSAASQVVHQCGSGVTACHNVLAMEHAGLNGSRLYPGSWSEWISDRSRPVAR
jgi:thiosulfate/3-mercaptopyruvate sulfurtransferase